MNVKNIITNVEYEAIQYKEYNSENVKKCKEFYGKHMNLLTRVIMPKLFVYNLELKGFETEIKPGDWILRTLTENPLYSVCSDEIMKQNFEQIK